MKRLALMLFFAALLAIPIVFFMRPGARADPGNSITSPDTTGAVGLYTSLALDASGNPVVGYYDLTQGTLKVLHCGNPACTSGNTIATPDTPRVGQYLSLALTGSGNPVVSYRDQEGALKVLHCGDTTCTSGNTIAVPDTAANVGETTSLVLDAFGNPVVGYYNKTGDDVNVLHCGNPTCTSANTIAAPDTVGDVGAHVSLVLDGDGDPVATYYDTENGGLKVLHCGDPTCTSDNTIAAPDSGAGVGEVTAIALDAVGNPVVSYDDKTNLDLKILHCGNPTCTSDNTIAAPDTVGDVGEYSSLVLDSIGKPVVSYYDLTGGGLKVLHCGDATCTSGNTIAAPDTVGDVGPWTSLALDAFGNPVVSYYDTLPNEDLKVLHCGDPNCTGVVPVGGIAELPDDSGSAGRSHLTLASLAAAALVALAAGAWYAKRRWLAPRR